MLNLNRDHCVYLACPLLDKRVVPDASGVIAALDRCRPAKQAQLDLGHDFQRALRFGIVGAEWRHVTIEFIKADYQVYEEAASLNRPIARARFSQTACETFTSLRLLIACIEATGSIAATSTSPVHAW